ncbi:hypothetical protein [Sinomonas albida]|uniref:hypothetical protein n=1 Tax=Sinomonas albida TaxID=369942 RepID=UPI00301B5DE3
MTMAAHTDPAGPKTIGIRLEPDVHIQLTLIAQLRGTNITEEIRKALAAHIAAAKDNTDLASQAQSAIEDIDRDAAARREAIARLFTPEQAEQKPRSPRGR